MHVSIIHKEYLIRKESEVHVNLAFIFQALTRRLRYVICHQILL